MKTTEEKARIMLDAAKADPPFSNLEYQRFGENVWRKYHYRGGEPSWNWAGNDWRIAPDTIAEGHNPDKLTVKQVGEGWRLLAEDEIVSRSVWSEHIQLWLRHDERWSAGLYNGENPNNTYRTQQPPGYFLPKSQPKTGVVKMWRYFVRMESGRMSVCELAKPTESQHEANI